MFHSVSTLTGAIIAIVIIAILAFTIYKAAKEKNLNVYQVLDSIKVDLFSSLTLFDEVKKAEEAGGKSAAENAISMILTNYLNSTPLLNSAQKAIISQMLPEAISWVFGQLVTFGILSGNLSNPKKYPVRRELTDNKASWRYGAGTEVAFSSCDLTHSMPPVFDQGQEGSCTANAGCTATSIALGEPGVILSRQYQYQNERTIEGVPLTEDNGAQMVDIGNAACKFGICQEGLFPYTPADLSATPSPAAVADALLHKPSKNIRISNLADAKQYISTHKAPVLVGIDVYESFESQEVANTGIVPMPKAGEQLMGGHAVLIVGYCDAQKVSLFDKLSYVIGLRKAPKSAGYVIIRNSWSNSWGLAGYCHVPYEYINSYAYDMYVIQK